MNIFKKAKDKIFKVGELCAVPYHNKNDFNYSYGIVVRQNLLKPRKNLYSVFYNGKVKEHENLFIAKIEEIEDESFNTD
jgi:hypothetical protein